MENKPNGRMDAVSTSLADSTESRDNTTISNLNDMGFSHVKSPALTCVSTAVRHFGNIGTLLHQGAPLLDHDGYKECPLVDHPLALKQHSYGRVEEHLKTDNMNISWADYVKVPRAKESTVQRLQAQRASTATCKFIKDEKEPSLIMDHPGGPGFGLPTEMAALDAFYDVEKKQPPPGFADDASSFTSTSSQGIEGSPNFLVELNPLAPVVLPQVRTELRGGQPSKGIMPNFDAHMTNAHAHAQQQQHHHLQQQQQQQQHHHLQQLMVYKNEVPRWSFPTGNAADAQFWSQSAGLSDDLYPYGAHGASPASQRHSPSYSTFPGMPPQRLCMICGDEASGCHYGVLTCGSCKVFFKRAVEGHHNYLCAGRNDCIVDKIRRKNCPACRLRKCYQAGMMLGGRKLKRFGALKAMGMSPGNLMFQSHLAMAGDGSASCLPGIREVQLSSQILAILENIEPEMAYSGFDNTQLDLPHALLNSLNRLCEMQLLWIVRWSKSLPGFRNLHISDQMTLIQYSWMNLMVFSLGWRSFKNVTSEFLYFAPDLILNQDQMRQSPIYDLCLAMQFIPQEFANLQVTREEFLCMKAIILLNTVPLEGLKSQAAFDEMRQSYIRELTKAIHQREKGMAGSSQLFYHLTKLMDSMHEIVKKVNLYCLSTYIQADAMKVEFPEMMSEVISSQLPKVLAGMVKPLLFHTK
ncbi:unnamed protein product [Arctogadus glacialis]